MVDFSDDQDEQLAWGRALARVRDSLGMGQQALAERLEWSVQNLGAYERGRRPGIMKRAIRKKLTDAMGVAPETLDRARAQALDLTPPSSGSAGRSGVMEPQRSFIHAAPPQALLPIRDRAQAGAWLPADDYIQDWPRRYPAAKDSRFPHADQWLTEVVGDSVDQLRIYSGDFVHCVDFIGAGSNLKTGDIVEVERLRADGSERELTIKQAEITANGLLLWPRSSNARWREPLELTDGLADGEEAEVRIRGIVLHVIRQIS